MTMHAYYHPFERIEGDGDYYCPHENEKSVGVVLWTAYVADPESGDIVGEKDFPSKEKAVAHAEALAALYGTYVRRL